MSSIFVSIPFQREIPCGRFSTTKVATARYSVFQFPSNGKSHADRSFGRISRHFGILKSFNSLPTGNPMRTYLQVLLLYSLLRVSIPFQREIPCGQPLFSAQSSRGSVEPKPNANCAGLFFGKNLAQHSDKPL